MTDAGDALPYTHLAVSVCRDGENVVTIETNSLSGRDLQPGDEEAIRDAARHLLAFVGAPADGELLFVLKGLLADIEDYQRLNHLGGEQNHWQVLARAVIAKAEAVAPAVLGAPLLTQCQEAIDEATTELWYTYGDNKRIASLYDKLEGAKKAIRQQLASLGARGPREQEQK